MIKSNYQLHIKDTGSVEFQVSNLTKRINLLTVHLQNYKKDFSSRSGLLKLIGQRKRLLNYLYKVDVERFSLLLTRLNIRNPIPNSNFINAPIQVYILPFLKRNFNALEKNMSDKG
uniref:30S ribosomal protein S15 n=1 Tax=Gloeochaete wittrockiana TaxID=38269 RepID=A0A3G1IVP8_9EUKA|nr:ribosomal protein S15 [Gloeochaete wittrockiana]YP_009546102.1 ribosomal protein S15 [Gloeochaete wittrockiana]ASQ40134.1 ribosomal protein S15 [Gloeochaete wittrockiana]ASQ40163.1 ribosomal protein S15 [Gloeochaete wittrockiana]